MAPRRGRPMLTLPRAITPDASRKSWTSRRPAAVSTRTTSGLSREVSSWPFTRPCSTANLPRHRTPLPHISASDPSTLNICMRTSASLRGGRTRIRPSAPTPKCRSLILTASPAGSSTCCSKAFT